MKIARELDDDDLDAVKDFPLSGELLAIYQAHKKTIGYGKSTKGSDIGFEKRGPKITIDERPQPGILSKCFGWSENKIDAALRRSNIVHELTHAAVVAKNLGGGFDEVGEAPVSEKGLKTIMTPSYMGEDLEAEIDAAIKRVRDALDGEKAIYLKLRHQLPGIGKTVDNAYDYVEHRLTYAESFAWEFPTVINGYYFFFDALGDGFDTTKTFWAIKHLAERQHQLRMGDAKAEGAEGKGKEKDRGQLIGATTGSED